MVRSCEVPGGMSIIQNTVPVSSSGTMPVGVEFMSHTSRPMLITTATNDDILWFMKKCEI